MIVSDPRRYAVVMGDLVRSESAPSPDQVHGLFNRAVDAQNLAQADALASPLTITLGDEFQGLAHTLRAALVIARGLRLHLMADGLDCRFVVGQVVISTPVNPEKAWNMMGPGLARARMILNEKSDHTYYRFSLPDDPGLETLLNALGAGLTLIERGWTDRQREVISALLAGHSAQDLAHIRNVTPHSIYKVRSSGHFDAYKMQWDAIAHALETHQGA